MHCNLGKRMIRTAFCDGKRKFVWGRAVAMNRKKVEQPVRLVWHIGPDAPQGEYIDAKRVQPPSPEPLDESRVSGFLVSSLDLFCGLDVSEADETVPGELMDELFNPPKT
ncbi:MAG: hypothetical protein KGL43_26445 [Burkholderiales bacterium]|nr:hypothetical protein [Burkholderiales bacterium]MDE2457146.1 hypothetical protein [Burkholderiales bacterium]